MDPDPKSLLDPTMVLRHLGNSHLLLNNLIGLLTSQVWPALPLSKTLSFAQPL